MQRRFKKAFVLVDEIIVMWNNSSTDRTEGGQNSKYTDKSIYPKNDPQKNRSSRKK